jgi:hypothetical protein
MVRVQPTVFVPLLVDFGFLLRVRVRVRIKVRFRTWGQRSHLGAAPLRNAAATGA